MDKEKSIKILNDLTNYLEITPNQLSESIGKDRSQWAYDVLNRKKKVGISKNIAELICTRYPQISRSWLLTGDGPMLVEEEQDTHKVEAMPMKLDHIVYAPLVSQYAYAGYLTGYADETYLENLPVVPFVADHEAKGNYVSFEVRGDSMDDGTDDGYIEGDRVLGREIEGNFWAKTKLHFRKWDFIIVHTEGILIKRIIDHDVENHLITVHSLNNMYPDRVIDLKDVKKIFNVIELQRPKRR